MLKPGGHIRVELEDGEIREHDTFTCVHGNELVRVPPGVDMMTVGHFCRNCMGHICDSCAEKMNRTLKCVPFEKKLERWESYDRFLRSIGIEQ
jgi:hypothetical protein